MMLGVVMAYALVALAALMTLNLLLVRRRATLIATLVVVACAICAAVCVRLLQQLPAPFSIGDVHYTPALGLYVHRTMSGLFSAIYRIICVSSVVFVLGASISATTLIRTAVNGRP
jgi:hypothetical protein